jgi:hypothetical protein
MHRDSEFPGLRLRLPDTFVGGVEACDVPALSREEDGVAPLTHADVQSFARSAVFNCLNQQRRGLLQEDGLVRRIHLVPIGFGIVVRRPLLTHTAGSE